jgi:CBS domain-containing protein
MKTTLESGHRARPFVDLRVIDVMHPGMISCPPETPLATVARMMSTYRVHAIFVHEHDDGWAVVTDADLVRAALAIELDSPARGIAAAPVLTVTTTAALEHAMQLMVEHEVTHVIVVEGRSGRPIGVVSSLDVARALAGLP